MSKPHNERLITNLADIRKELVETVSAIPDSDLDWKPEASMKGYRALLQEIGMMEKECVVWLKTGELLEWNYAAHVPAQSIRSALQELESIRADTNAFLERASEEKLETAIAVPEEWQQYMGTQIEPEEVVRWIAQHEYYHLGQIISYRWIQGHNPYGERPLPS